MSNKSGIKITNGKQVKLDFAKYAKKTNGKNIRTISKYAKLIQNRMKWILRQKVINWTGNLAGSISIDYFKHGATITPDTPYDKWIEYGGGSFEGYHYIEESVQRYEDEFIRALKKDL